MLSKIAPRLHTEAPLEPQRLTAPIQAPVRKMLTAARRCYAFSNRTNELRVDISFSLDRHCADGFRASKWHCAPTPHSLRTPSSDCEDAGSLLWYGEFGEGIIGREPQNSLCSPDQRKYATPQEFFSKASQGIVARVKTLVCVCREIFFPDFLSRITFGEGIIEHEAQSANPKVVYVPLSNASALHPKSSFQKPHRA